MNGDSVIAIILIYNVAKQDSIRNVVHIVINRLTISLVIVIVVASSQ